MGDKKNKKRFIVPEAEIVNFVNDDIITASLTANGTADWDEGDKDLWE